mmetsp:Transcript_16077/g.40488  ORF Transcript_16077/g.40488 Transcript_16077/m.40488 type:complete len:201 (-) Transcript_16077:1457-2059(-)
MAPPSRRQTRWLSATESPAPRCASPSSRPPAPRASRSRSSSWATTTPSSCTREAMTGSPPTARTLASTASSWSTSPSRRQVPCSTCATSTSSHSSPSSPPHPPTSASSVSPSAPPRGSTPSPSPVSLGPAPASPLTSPPSSRGSGRTRTFPSRSVSECRRGPTWRASRQTGLTVPLWGVPSSTRFLRARASTTGARGSRR